jgi:predicted methyltransferase
MADNHADAPSLEDVLAMDSRAADAVRDRYRHPAETLHFFGVEPTMRVVEFGPGGGWYTRLLLPWLAPQGEYMAMQADTGPGEPGQPGWA